MPSDDLPEPMVRSSAHDTIDSTVIDLSDDVIQDEASPPEINTKQAQIPAIDHQQYEPYSSADLLELSTSELQSLALLFKEHLQRVGRCAALDGPAAQMVWPICVTIIAAPHELGVSSKVSPLCESTVRLITAAGSDSSLPEAEVCRLWSSWTVSGSGATSVDLARLVSLASEPLWEPVLSLAYRALAFWGLRHDLANALPREGPISLCQADAWLEASQPVAGVGEWQSRPTRDSAIPLPPEIIGKWHALLEVESELARHPGTANSAEAKLSALTIMPANQGTRTYALATQERLAARATAALVRLRIAHGLGDNGLLSSNGGGLLPEWERQYLRGLVYWLLKDWETADGCLKKALSLNPRQSCVRLACAALPLRRDHAESLRLLDIDKPSEEIRISRAALFCRLRQYDEAQNELKKCEEHAGTPNEPVRFSWARGRQQMRSLKNLLATALAERGGDWKKAGALWQTACGDQGAAALRQSRHLLVATCEAKSIGRHEARRLEDLERAITRLRFQAGKHHMIGTAAFFHGVASIEESPEQSLTHLRSLLKRRIWTEKECRMGGQRIRFLADCFVGLGVVDEARQAYKMAGETGQVEAMFLYEILSMGTGSADTSDAHGSPGPRLPTSSSSETFWPHLLAALALVARSDAAGAGKELDEARQKGIPCAMEHCVTALCALASGNSASISESDLSSLPITSKTKALIRLLIGNGDFAGRVKDFVNAYGGNWADASPLNVPHMINALVVDLCAQGKYDESLKLLDCISDAESSPLSVIRILISARHSLCDALSGEPQRVERALADTGNAG